MKKFLIYVIIVVVIVIIVLIIMKTSNNNILTLLKNKYHENFSYVKLIDTEYGESKYEYQSSSGKNLL